MKIESLIFNLTSKSIFVIYLLFMGYFEILINYLLLKDK